MSDLKPFTSEDIHKLLQELNRHNAEFLMQFAGPEFDFPLTREQMIINMNEENLLLFKFVRSSGETIGHCQLSGINREPRSATIGRVLIYDDYLKQGLGQLMLELLIEYSKANLGLEKLYLDVYDFNKSAINCYLKLGFRETERKDYFYKKIDATWGNVKMEKSLIQDNPA